MVVYKMEEEYNEYDYYGDDGYDEFKIGYRQLENIGAPREEYDAMMTDIAGNKELERIQQRIVVDDFTMFSIKLDDLLRMKKISSLLRDEDKKAIKRKASELSFISKRNPLSLILSYHLFVASNRKEALKTIKSILKDISDKSSNLFSVIKYEAVWKN